MALRIGLVTDIHHGPDMDTRIGSASLRLLDLFVEEMAGRFRPDLVVDLGDRINDVDPGADAERLREVRSRLEAVGVPVLFAYGNHDLVNVPAAEARAILGKRGDHESLDVGPFHLVVLNSQDPTFEGVGGTLSDPQLDWLEDDLARTGRPVVVFSHHPLDEQESRSHWYFAHHPTHALAVNRERARRLFRRSGRVRAVFNGHMHWNHVDVIDGIPYVTVMSLVDASVTDGPAGCYAEIALDEAGPIEVKVRGNLPMGFAWR